MKDLFLVLVGAFCAACGGFFSTWYQARKARQIKMRETIGEQQVEVYKEALALISELLLLLIQRNVQDAIEFMTTHQQWFMNSVILLPHKFVENWISIRSNLYICVDVDEDRAVMPNGPEKSKLRMKVQKLKAYVEKLGTEAMNALEKASGLRHPKIQRPPEEKQKQ